MYYCIEMFRESGHWTLAFNTTREGKRSGKAKITWAPTGGEWLLLGGRWASEDDAYEAIARFTLAGSSAKPLRFRAYPV